MALVLFLRAQTILDASSRYPERLARPGTASAIKRNYVSETEQPKPRTWSSAVASIQPATRRFMITIRQFAHRCDGQGWL